MTVTLAAAPFALHYLMPTATALQGFDANDEQPDSPTSTPSTSPPCAA